MAEAVAPEPVKSGAGWCDSHHRVGTGVSGDSPGVQGAGADTVPEPWALGLPGCSAHPHSVSTDQPWVPALL